MTDVPTTFLMVEPIKPLSGNAKGRSKERFMLEIRNAANNVWSADYGLLTDHLYARITHLCSPGQGSLVDVDNTAKRILDALKLVVIADDKYICQCLQSRVLIDWEGFDLNTIANPDILTAIIANANADHILIVEIGNQPGGQPLIRSGPVEISS